MTSTQKGGGGGSSRTLNKLFKPGQKHSQNIFLDIPLLGILVRPLSYVIAPVWNTFCAIRWLLASPLQIRVLPRCFPGCTTVPYLKHLPHVTYGEVRYICWYHFGVAIAVVTHF